MTDLNQPGDDRETARRAAAAHTAASHDLEAFLRRLPEVPGSAAIVEYAALLTREELLRRERQAAVGTVGLEVPSMESE